MGSKINRIRPLRYKHLVFRWDKNKQRQKVKTDLDTLREMDKCKMGSSRVCGFIRIFTVSVPLLLAPAVGSNMVGQVFNHAEYFLNPHLIWLSNYLTNNVNSSWDQGLSRGRGEILPREASSNPPDDQQPQAKNYPAAKEIGKIIWLADFGYCNVDSFTAHFSFIHFSSESLKFPTVLKIHILNENKGQLSVVG